VIKLTSFLIPPGFRVGDLPSGEKSSIQDIEGITVGHIQLIKGEGKLKVGQGPVRTGITMINPSSENVFQNPLTCSAFIANGYGKTAGLAQIKELGVLETPIFLTSTMAVGRVWEGAARFVFQQNPHLAVEGQTINPLVGECNDGYLNDLYGGHIQSRHVMDVARELSSDLVKGGSEGAGTGMVAFGYKGGIGNSSRIIDYNGCRFTLGCLVLANFGERKSLRINGIPVGKDLPTWEKNKNDGSIMVILATDIPLDNRQLQRICQRAPLGLGLTGSVLGHGSGDFVLAFSTTNIRSRTGELIYMSKKVREKGEFLNKVFQGVVEAVAQAVYDALLQAETMTGRDNRRVEALPVEKIMEILQGG